MKIRLLLFIFIAIPQLLNAQFVTDNDTTHLGCEGDLIVPAMHNGRRVQNLTGNVRFTHKGNGATMDCDSAFLYPSGDTVYCFGNVIIQHQNTVLFGDTLFYDGTTAKVGGRIVRMLDEQRKAELLTQFIDYRIASNTGDYYRGGTLTRGKDTIESINGKFDGNTGLFTFIDDVAMQSESYVLACDTMFYNTRDDVTIFKKNTKIWNGANFMLSQYGWYKPNDKLMHFADNSYIVSGSNEVWADSIFYDEQTRNSKLYKNVQMLDTAQNALIFGDEALLENNPEKITVTKKPAALYFTVPQKPGEISDTTYLVADTIQSIMKYNPDFPGNKERFAKQDSTAVDTTNTPKLDQLGTTNISEKSENSEDSAITTTPAIADSLKTANSIINNAKIAIDTTANNVKNNVKNIADTIAQTTIAPIVDTIKTDKKNNEKIKSDKKEKKKKSKKKKAKEDDLTNEPNIASKNANSSGIGNKFKQNVKPSDSDATKTLKPIGKDTNAKTNTTPDSTINKPQIKCDTCRAVNTTDSIYRDIIAFKHVRVYKTDFQSVCDSLSYCTIDSTTRMFYNPILWNDSVQITSGPSVFYSKNQQINYADFSNPAFIIMQEDSVNFDQIKGKKMRALFRNNQMYRLNVLGNAQSIYFLREKTTDPISAVEISESSSIRINVLNNRIQNVSYFMDPTSNTFPLDQIPDGADRLKDFKWYDDIRPKSKKDLFTRVIRPTQRKNIVGKYVKPTFAVTRRLRGISK